MKTIWWIRRPSGEFRICVRRGWWLWKSVERWQGTGTVWYRLPNTPGCLVRRGDTGEECRLSEIRKSIEEGMLDDLQIRKDPIELTH